MLRNMDEIYITFSRNNLLTPVTPNDLWLKFKIVTFVAGLQVYHVHKSHDHAT